MTQKLIIAKENIINRLKRDFNVCGSDFFTLKEIKKKKRATIGNELMKNENYFYDV